MSSPASEVFQHLRAAVLRQGAALTDGQLLGCFIDQGDDTAFAALVRRHGPMVWGVCRRVARDHHDAEDAFQATFLVLTRKAASIAPREMVGNWLHGVAYQTALKARALASRRKAREKQVTDPPEPAVAEPELWRDLRQLLDEELSRLPDRYRAVVVLCELEGKPRSEVARQLGRPEGTVAGWLARARALLAERLARRGLAVGGASLAMLFSQNLASAAVPGPVLTSTINAAALVAAGQSAAMVVPATVAALTDGVLKAMLLSKLKTDALFVLVCALALGGGVLLHQAVAQKPGGDKPVKKPGAAESRGEIHGVVKSVDATAGTITLLGGKFTSEQTYTIAKDAKVLVDDGSGKKTGFRDGKLTDLADGALATIRLNADKKAALIYVEGPTLTGELKEVDARAGTVTLLLAASKTKGVTDQKFLVASDAIITIDDGTGTKEKKASKLADLTVGSLVTLKMAGDMSAARQVLSQGPSVKGTVKAVDGKKNTITVEVMGSDKTEKATEKTFEVARDVKVALEASSKKTPGGKEVALSELKAGINVSLRLSLDQKVVVGVVAAASHVQAVVSSVDTAKNTLTVTLRKKGEPDETRTYEVAKDATIHIDGKAAKLADLPSEAHVTLRLPANESVVVNITAEGPAVRGSVRGNATDDGITVGQKNDDQSFTVGKDVKVLIAGKPGKMSDLIEGTIVSARASADRKQLIGVINAEGPSYRGVVKSVDKDKITVTIGGKNGVGGEDKEYAVTRDTQVVTEMNGVVRKYSDVKTDSEVGVRLTIDQKAVARITLLGE